MVFHQRVMRVEIRRGPGIGQLPRQHARCGWDQSIRWHDAETPGHAQVMGIDDQRAHLKPAEVQDGRADLGTYAGQVLEPCQRVVDRPILEEVQVQAAASGMDLSERGRQMHRLPFGKGEWCEKWCQVVRCRIADGLPTSILLNDGLEDLFRDRGLRSRAQEGQNQLAEWWRAQPGRSRSIVIQQFLVDFGDPCRWQGGQRVLHELIFEQNKNISSEN